MALNFGLLDTSIPERLGAMPANALAMRRQRVMQDEDRAFQREGQQMQNALAQMQMRKAQGEMEQEQAYRNALSQAPAGDWNAVLPEIRKVAPDRAMALEKQLGEMQKGKAEMRAKMSDVAHKKLGMYREALVNVNSPQQFAQWLTAQHSDPDLQELMGALPSLEDSLATIPQDPREFEQMKVKSAVGIGKFMEMNKPSDFERTMDAAGLSPEQRQAAARQRLMKETTHAPASNITNYGQPVSAVDPQTGQPVLVQFDKSGQAKVAPFAPYNAGAAEKKASKEAGSKSAVQLIDEALPWIDKATGSNIGAARDAAGRVVGMSSSASQAAARLEALQGALMMAQPRMEGPQSNLDVQLYERMAGRIGDRTVPAAEKRAAMDTIRALHQKYTSGQAAKTPASSQGGVKFLGFE